MKKILIVLLAMVLLSGCIAKTVKNGDTISVDYVGSLEDGKVFDTSIESVAAENNITKPEYKPLNFTVGRGEVIRGFDEGVVGMKIGERKILTILPEKAYGIADPRRIRTLPVVQSLPATDTFPRVFNISLNEFNTTFGSERINDKVVRIPGSNVDLLILNTTRVVTLSYNLSVGDKIYASNLPWNQTVVKIDKKNITVKHNVEKGNVIQYFPGAPWNTTVVNISNESITLRHNAIPDTMVKTTSGRVKVSFNETSIIIDGNNELAGKTLIFNVTLRAIGK